MADVKGLIADPDFQKLSPAGKRAALGEVDPDFKGLSDTGVQSFLDQMTAQVAPKPLHDPEFHGPRLKGKAVTPTVLKPLEPVGESMLSNAATAIDPDQSPAARASGMIRAVGTGALPVVAGSLAANPVGTVVGGAAGGLTQNLLEKFGEMLGYPGAGRLAGDVAGAYAGGKASELPWRSPVTFGEPRIPVLPDVIEKYSPPGKPAVHPSLKEALMYEAARRATGMHLQSPIAPEVTPRVPEWATHPAPQAVPLPAIEPIPGSLPSGRVPGTGTPPPQQPGPVRLPGWAQAGMPAPPPAELPQVQPIPGQLPSGRVPGSGIPTPTPAPNVRVPEWILHPEPQAIPLPSFEPIPGPLPSGRVPGTGTPTLPPPPNMRTPGWSAVPAPERAPLPSVEPIPGALPSGRIPGGGRKLTAEQQAAVDRAVKDIGLPAPPAATLPEPPAPPSPAPTAPAPVAAPTPAPKPSTPTDVVIPMPESLPERYREVVESHGAARAQSAYAKDTKVAQLLKDNGITPDKFAAMSLDEQNGWIKKASAKHQPYKVGFDKSRGRDAEQGIRHTLETLRELWDKD